MGQAFPIRFEAQDQAQAAKRYTVDGKKLVISRPISRKIMQCVKKNCFIPVKLFVPLSHLSPKVGIRFKQLITT